MTSKKLDPQFDVFKKCPLCRGTRFRIWEQALDAAAVHPTRVRCRRCGLIFSNPQASDLRLKGFYENEYFAGRRRKTGFFQAEVAARQASKARRDLALIEGLVEPGRILDVGTAGGFFLLEAQKRGWIPEGVEASKQAARRGRALGLKIHHGMVEDLFTRRRFQAIHAAQVLDHVKDPLEFLRRLKSLLAPGGVLLVEVSNAMRLRELIRHLGPRLRGRTPVLNYAQEHTFDFTRFTLRAAHLRSGLKIVRSRTYEYPGGALNLWRKKGERPAKAAARAAFILVAKIFHLENILGSYLQVFSKGKA